MNGISTALIACAPGFVVHGPLAEAQTETVLYSFCPSGYPCPDGQYPASGVINVKGALYGTTGSGGTDADCYYGTVI